MTTNGYLFIQDGKKRLAYLSDCKEVPPDALRQIAGSRLLCWTPCAAPAPDAHVSG